jgi:myosin heavy subunit
MTLLGKVFTVLILIMSLVFMSFAVCVFATHRNWKQLVTNPSPAAGEKMGWKEQYDREIETNKGLKAQLDKVHAQLAQEQAARRHAIGALETKLTEAQSRLSEKEAELAKLQSAESEAAAALKTATATVEALRGEVGELRKEIRLAQTDRDDQFNKVVQLTDNLHAAAGVERNLKERQTQLLVMIDDMKKVMDAYGLKAGMDISKVPPPLDGIVVAVGDKNLIEVSLGSDDGLRVGHRLELFRNTNYLGSAVVVKTDTDRAVAQVDAKSQRGKIEVRDRVATRLSRTGTG